jgi:adenylate cyclase class IV
MDTVKPNLFYRAYSFILWGLRRFLQMSGKDNLEVERKYRMTLDQSKEMPQLLPAKGFHLYSKAELVDIFLPGQEDEMVRLRRETNEDGTHFILTFKRWERNAKGERERRENECRLPQFIAKVLLYLAKHSVSQPLLTFSKLRQHFEGKLTGRTSVVSIDQVTGLGQYSGDYLEIEVLLSLQDQGLAQVRESIAGLALALMPNNCQMVEQSYLDLLKRSLQENLATSSKS